MKIFNKNGGENFVDINNVFVGYDTEQWCCEDAGWFISDKEENLAYDKKGDKIIYPNFDISPYVFDTKYFQNVDCSQLDEGGMVRFRLTATRKKSLFLHLYNCHNGYYGHGFEAKIGGQNWQEGTL